jgi:hypothetical protein
LKASARTADSPRSPAAFRPAFRASGSAAFRAESLRDHGGRSSGFTGPSGIRAMCSAI